MRRALLLALGCCAAFASAAEAPAVPAGMQRMGEGTLRWFGLTVYRAQLWSAARPVDFSHPFALSLRYARALTGRAIAERSREEIARLGLGSPARRRAWEEVMRGLFPDVAKGDSLTGLYLPGRGARFFHNARPLGQIDDPQFARAFFSIWLDPRTSAPGLRAELLGTR